MICSAIVKNAITLIGLISSVNFVAAQNVTQVTVGTAQAISDTAIYVTFKKGWFREEGIDAKIVDFDSAARMVAPLGAGQLDVGAGSASAGLYNAYTRGVAIRIVADKAASLPLYGSNKLIIRNDLVESGRFKTLRDLKGLRIAMVAPGVSNTSTLNSMLRSVGLRYSDVETVDMPPTNHVLALSNKAVDGGVTLEPMVTIAAHSGYGRIIMRDDEIDPGHQLAVLLYSESFARNQDLGVRFMRAYLRGLRFYQAALKDGRLAGPNSDEIMTIITETTPIKDKKILSMITPAGVDPNGRVNQVSLQKDLDFYTEQGLIEKPVDIGKMIDMSFVEAALKSLGSR